MLESGTIYMWLRKSSPRRQSIRGDVAEAESLIRPSRKKFGPVAAVALAFFVLATLIVYFPRESLPYHVGDTPPIALRARVGFTYTADDAAAREKRRQDERTRTPQVLLINSAILSGIEGQLLNLQVSVHGVRNAAALPESLRGQFPHLDDRAVVALQALELTPQAYARDVSLLLATLRESCPIVTPDTAQRIAARAPEGLDTVVLSSSPTFDKQSLSRPIMGRDVITLHTTDPLEQRRLRDVVAHALPDQLVEPVFQYLLKLGEPTFTEDPSLTEKLADFRALTAKPNSIEIKAEQVLVAAGEAITPLQYQQLLAAQWEYEEFVARNHPWRSYLPRLGQAMTVLVLTLAGVLYVSRMHRETITLGRGWALCGLLLLTLFIAKNATVLLPPQAMYLLGIAPTLLATIIMIVVFNQRFALAVASIHALLVTVALGQSLDFFLVLLTGIGVFTFSLSEIRTRIRLTEVGFFASAGLFITVWALGLTRMFGSGWSPSWTSTTYLRTLAIDSLFAAGTGILVAMFALLIVPLIENVFKITTGMTLLELCDANRPLLRRLAQEAPGTFNHSLTVGTMAEAAADAIGVNGLLCRAGAYYHDVGKLSKPHYFIENQAGGPNRHDKLSPAMSLLIIVGHVKDGIELAREYGLPWILHQFIGQHHGTTLVEYFFHAARKRQEAGGDDAAEVREAEFRYPGPKPQTKEAAILMICDGVESIVRGLGDPSAGKIEATVHNLVVKRLMDGQFSECDLTLRELSMIETALTKALAGIYHGRVAYPPRPAFSQTA